MDNNQETETEMAEMETIEKTMSQEPVILMEEDMNRPLSDRDKSMLALLKERGLNDHDAMVALNTILVVETEEQKKAYEEKILNEAITAKNKQEKFEEQLHRGRKQKGTKDPNLQELLMKPAHEPIKFVDVEETRSVWGCDLDGKKGWLNWIKNIGKPTQKEDTQLVESGVMLANVDLTTSSHAISEKIWIDGGCGGGYWSSKTGKVTVGRACGLKARNAAGIILDHRLPWQKVKYHVESGEFKIGDSVITSAEVLIMLSNCEAFAINPKFKE